jgi:hypothetical protein
MTVDGTQQGALNVMADSSGMELNAFSQDSTRICYAKTGHPSKPNGMYVMNILTGVETHVAPTGDNKLGSCAFSKTTNEIFYPYTDAGVAQEIRAVNLSTYAVRVLQRFDGADVTNSHISLNSDGSYLSVGFHAHNAFFHVMLKASDGTLHPNWKYDVSTPDEDGYGDYGYWHPTNPKLIRVSRDKVRAVWNIDTLAKVSNPTPMGLAWNLPGSHACWTLDGEIFFSVAAGHPDCYPLDKGKGEETRVVMDRFGGTIYPYLYFTPLKNLAGKGVYPSGVTGVIALHYTNNAEVNGEVRYAHAHPHFSRDGKYILWSSPVTNTSEGSPPGGVGTSPYKVDLFVIPLTDSPPTGTPCTNTLTSTVSIPTGYGASYNLFTTTKELLVKASCSGTTATLTLGSPQTYTYRTAYTWSGTAWQPHTLTCTDRVVSSSWCAGEATANTTLTQNPTALLGYTCSWVNSSWKCGCRDTTCPTSQWQMQRIQR